MKTRRAARLGVLFVSLCMCACDCGPTETSEPRGVQGRGAAGSTEEPAADPFREPDDRGRDPLRKGRRNTRAEAAEQAEDTGGEERAASPTQPADQQAPRDLGAELRAAANASGCARAEGGTELPERAQVSIEAYVSATGVVTRATASSADLSAATLRCFEQRIEAHRFAEPIPDAPRAVRTNLVLERRAL